MLDDLKYIHDRDVQDALGIAERQTSQLLQDYALSGSSEFGTILNVVYAGMGSSALAADLVNTWPRLAVPFEIVRDYDLPKYVGERTLVIAASYSGNTEETLSAFKQAQKAGAQIAVITAGGALLEEAKAGGYLYGVLPTIVQPRYAALANFKILLGVLQTAGLITDDVSDELKTAAAFVDTSVATWLPLVPTAQNPAKQLALEVIGKSVVVYSGPKLAPAAYKWKIAFNENAKQVAWTGQYPEFNHNEFMGWTKQPTDKPYQVIDFRSPLEDDRIQKRLELSERLLSGLRPSPEIVVPAGETIFQQLLWLLAFGDFVTLYTGIANGLNPTPVELVEKFKKELQ